MNYARLVGCFDLDLYFLVFRLNLRLDFLGINDTGILVHRAVGEKRTIQGMVCTRQAKGKDSRFTV